MREIKVRGYSSEELIKESQWIEGYGVTTIEYTDGTETTHIFTPYGDYRVEKESVGQYTGRKDENGKEIYEGDIVKFLDEITVEEKGYLDRTAIVNKIGVVTWDNEELGYNIDTKYPNEHHYLCCGEEVKVIGNIYENIDLLK